MRFRRNRSLGVRMRRVLERNSALLATVNEKGVTPDLADALPGFLKDLHQLQVALWSAAASDPQANLVRLAQPVDQLVTHWSAIAEGLGTSSHHRAA